MLLITGLFSHNHKFSTQHESNTTCDLAVLGVPWWPPIFGLKPRPANFELLKKQFFAYHVDRLHKWRLNLNNNTWYIVSLTFMFQDKGIFTWMWGYGCTKYCYSNLGTIYAKGLCEKMLAVFPHKVQTLLLKSHIQKSRFFKCYILLFKVLSKFQITEIWTSILLKYIQRYFRDVLPQPHLK